MSNKTGIIIQAHIPSTRLYGKVLKQIGDKSIIHNVIDNCLWVRETFIDEVIVSIPSDKINTPLKLEIQNHPRINDTSYLTVLKLHVYEGKDSDVLGRFYDCATKHELNTIVRITSDCPLISSDMINLVVKTFFKERLDYLSFTEIDGLDVEVFSFKVLKYLHENTTDVYHREHVTTNVKNYSHKFKIAKLSDFKFSVDTKDDLKRVNEIYNS